MALTFLLALHCLVMGSTQVTMFWCQYCSTYPSMETLYSLFFRQFHNSVAMGHTQYCHNCLFALAPHHHCIVGWDVHNLLFGLLCCSHSSCRQQTKQWPEPASIFICLPTLLIDLTLIQDTLGKDLIAFCQEFLWSICLLTAEAHHSKLLPVAKCWAKLKALQNLLNMGRMNTSDPVLEPQKRAALNDFV